MIKNKQYNQSLSVSLGYAVYSLCFVLLFFVLSSISASAISADLAKRYDADENFTGGEVVSIDDNRADFVLRASQETGTRLLGVVVPESDASLQLESNKDGVDVAIAGRAMVNVDLSNGEIGRGDLIGLSSVDGVGAKANEGSPVVGVAEASFTKSESEQGQKTVPVLISVGVAPTSFGSSAVANTTWLRSIAGNNVSALQLAFVFFIAAVGVVAIIILTYSSVRNGLVAVGRNPLAKPAILNALSQSMVMVAVVAISCFGLMYFMLRL